MLHTIQILSLRDFALEHLPKVRALRELNARFGKHAAEETVAEASRTFLLDPLATASERQALRLLDFIHLHPKNHWTTHFREDDLTTEQIESNKSDLKQALELQPVIEQHILEAARLLNGLSGVPLPPWLTQTETPAPATTETSRATANVSPPQTNGGITRHKLRTNSLDAPIQEAIAKAGTTKMAAVFQTLKERALAGDAQPFNGSFEGGALVYTNDKNEQATLSKDALGKRIKNLTKAGKRH